MNATVKFTSFRSLASAMGIAKKQHPLHNEYWTQFLKRKGHTTETFGYLPDDLQTALRSSWLKSNEFKQMNNH